MVKEERVGCVEGAQPIHILSRKNKVENVQIFGHPLLVHTLGNDDNPFLQQEAQGHLCGRFAIALAYRHQDRLGEKPVAPLCQWSPRHQTAVELFEERLQCALLVEDVGLHLVHHRHNLRIRSKVYEMVGKVVTHAYGPHFTCPIGFFQGTPGIIAITERLVQQHEVYNRYPACADFHQSTLPLYRLHSLKSTLLRR